MHISHLSRQLPKMQTVTAIWSGAQDFAFLMSSQVIPMLLMMGKLSVFLPDSFSLFMAD
jgi:hypothetical protein